MESGNNMIMVTFNYRVGLFGFLASSEVQQNGNVNAGILDMIAALQWVQQHISQVRESPIRAVDVC
jgi:acetylcholinesterase